MLFSILKIFIEEIEMKKAELSSLKRTLKKHGIKQRVVAARACVGIAAVSHFLNGRSPSKNIHSKILEIIKETENQ